MQKLEFLAGSEKRFYEFIGNLTEKDKIAMLSHHDGDGVMSAVITSKVLGKIDYVDFLDYKAGMLKNIAGKLREKKVNKIIILDLSVDSEEASLKEFEKFAEIMIVDHHLYTKDLNSSKTTFIRTASGFPATYTCYYLFSKIQKIPEWLGVLGTLSDMVYKYKKETAEQIYDDFGFTGERQNLWDFVMMLGNALVYFSKGYEKVYDIVMKAKTLEDLRGLSVYAKAVEEELNFYLKDFEEKKEEHNGLFYYYFKPKFLITSQISTIISLKDKAKTFIFVDEYDGVLRVSARCQSGKVDCVRLLQEAIKDIPDSSAGGHVPAAGARVPSKFLNKFKENIFKAYDSLK